MAVSSRIKGLKGVKVIYVDFSLNFRVLAETTEYVQSTGSVRTHPPPKPVPVQVPYSSEQIP